MYVASTAVVVQELIKLTTCVLLLWRERNFDARLTAAYLREEIFGKRGVAV